MIWERGTLWWESFVTFPEPSEFPFSFKSEIIFENPLWGSKILLFSSPILDLCPVSSVSLLPNVPTIFPMLWRVLPTLDSQVDGQYSYLNLISLNMMRCLCCSLETSTLCHQLASQPLSQIGFSTQTSLSMSWGADDKGSHIRKKTWFYEIIS